MKIYLNKISNLSSIPLILIFAALLLKSFSLQGQNLSSSVIGAGGETFINGSYSLNFTLGELSVESYQNQTSLLTQGFHQGTEGNTSVDEHQNKNVQLEIYPNPVSQKLNLKYDADLKPQYCEIADIMGQTMVNMQIDQTSCTLNVSAFKPGTYFIKLRFSDQSVSTQIFIKK